MSSGSDRLAEPAEASLTGHKRDAAAAAITDKQANEHADTGDDNNKRARVDGDGAADSSSSASGSSGSSGSAGSALAAGPFSRLASVEVESVLQLLDLKSLLRVAATCRSLARDALRPASGKFIEDDGRGVGCIVLAAPDEFQKNLQLQREQRRVEKGGAEADAASATTDPDVLSLDSLPAEERCPVLCAHLAASFAPARMATYPSVQHHGSSARLSSQLLLRARRFAQSGGKRGVCELDLKGCDQWPLADVLQLLAEPWLRSVSALRLPLSGAWMQRQVQMALFALPRLSSLTIEAKGDGRLLAAAVRQATQVRSLKLVYPACEVSQLRALAHLPGPLTSLAFDATPPKPTTGRGRGRGPGGLGLGRFVDDLSDNRHHTPCFPLFDRLARLPALWGLGALEQLDLHQLDLKHARSAAVRDFFAALPRLSVVRAQQAEIDALLRGLSRLPRNRATAAGASSGTGAAASGAAAAAAASGSNPPALPLLRDVHWSMTRYEDDRIGCGGVTAEPVLRRFCRRFPLTTVHLDENRGEDGFDQAEGMRAQYKLWAPQVDTLWKEALREQREEYGEPPSRDDDDECDVANPEPRPDPHDSDDQDGLPHSDAERRDDELDEEWEDQEEEEEEEEEKEGEVEEKAAAADV